MRIPVRRIRVSRFALLTLGVVLAQQGVFGQIFAFGNNSDGQLGIANPANTPVAQSPSITGATAISGSTSHVLALKGDGTVWAWGLNHYGELGNSINVTTNIANPTPAQVSGLTGIVAIAAGTNHSLALKNDGTVWAWGRNQFGQLGNPNNSGTSNANPTPVQVTGLTGITAIAGLYNFCLALKNDGTIWAWGYNYYGQLGSTTNNQSTTAANPTPTQISGLTGFVAIATGSLHSLGLKSDGTVWAWGNNAFAQLGFTANSTPNPTPAPVPGLTGITTIAAGANHSLAIMNDGTVWAWGFNGDGELGIGTNNLNVSTPTQSVGLSGITAIAGGDLHSVALKSDGTVWTWGFNFYGELGTATNFNTGNPNSTPAQVSGLAGIGAISAGSVNTFALIPVPVNVTMSVPSSVSFTVSGTGCQPGTYNATTAFSWLPGTPCQVVMNSPLPAGTGTQQVFKDWTDGPTTATRNFIAPAADTVYTAEYKTQYLLTVAVNPATAGTATGGGYFDANSTPTVSVTPAAGNTFVNWTGPVTSPNNPTTTVTLSGPTTVTANVNIALTLLTATITAANKPYDRTTAATITNCTLSGVPAGDQGNVSCSTTNAAFSDANVGTGKTVTATIVLSQTAATSGRYGLTAPIVSTSANIVALNITASVTAANKPYDGTTTATVNNCTPNNVIAGDTVTCSAASGAFSSANAGTWTVTASGITLGGAQSMNYGLSSTTATTSATINKATPGFTLTGPPSSVYGQGVTLPALLTVPQGTTPTGQVTISFPLNSGVYYVCSNGSVTTTPCSVNVSFNGTSYGATVAPALLPAGTLAITANYTGDVNFNNVNSSSVMVTITRASSTVSVVKAPDPSVYGNPVSLTVRVMDNTANSAAAPSGTAGLSFTFNSISYLICGDGSLSTSSCATAITLAPDPTDNTGRTSVATVMASRLPVGSYAINSTYAGDNNFSASSPSGLAQSVTQRPITVSAATDSKPYDGTTSSTGVPTVTTGSILAGDSGTFTQTFDNRNVGTGKTLTPKGSVNDGNGGNNYVVTFANSTNGSVIARAITVTAAANSKPYDGTTSATATPTAGTPGLAAGDAGNFTETYLSKNAGTGLTLVPTGTVNDGNGGNNYIVTFANSSNGAIIKATLTITAVSNTKPFDGTVSAAAAPMYSGVQTGDSVSGLAETYNTPNSGTGKTLSVSAYTISDGNSGGNYTVNLVPNNTGVITPLAENGAVMLSAPELQYTAAETFTATLPVAMLGGEAAATSASFYVCPSGATTVTAACQNMTPAPVALTLAGSGLTGTTTVNLVETVKGALAPGAHTVVTVFANGPDFVLNMPTAALKIDQLIAQPTGNTLYTGAPVFWTASTFTNTATLYLSATVTDPCSTQYPAGYAACADVSKGTITFNVWNGTTLTPIPGATNLPVGLVNAGATSVGSAAAIVQYTLSSKTQVSIRITAGSYYTGGNPSQGITTVLTPFVQMNEMKMVNSTLCDSPTAANAACPADSIVPQAGLLAGEPAHLTQLNGDVVFFGRIPFGLVNAQVTSMYKLDGTLDTSLHTYEITSNLISTFSQLGTGVANFTSHATIVDITNLDGLDDLQDPNVVSIDGLMQITACAAGSACPGGPASVGAGGAIAIQVNDSKTGNVMFSSGWNGKQTVPQNAAAGTVSIN